MFRSAPGFKAKYHDLTLLVASDFDEWKVILEGPDVTILGGRQFTESKAKESAQKVAESYFREEKKEEVPALEALEWQPLAKGEFLNWRP
jgi:hypothetical protein